MRLVLVVLCVALAAVAARAEDLAPPSLLARGPILLVTAEYTPYDRLVEPRLVSLLARYGAAVCVCVREGQLNDALDRLYTVYERAGIPILLWPLLPYKEGLYLNKGSVPLYLDALDGVFDWAAAHGHRVEALIVDVEPSNYGPARPAPSGLQKWGQMRRQLNRKEFPEAVRGFERVIAKIHGRGALAVAAAFPFVIDDRLKGRHGWEDLTGGPVATVGWDALTIMMYSSWFVEAGSKMGVGWDAAHHLAYQYARDLRALWGDRVAVAVGVTSAGEGNEKRVYATSGEIVPAIAAVRAAGIRHIGIYDLKGLLESGDVEPWLAALRDTPPGLPAEGKYRARAFRGVMRLVGAILESLR